MKVRLEQTKSDLIALELSDQDISRIISGLPAIGEKRVPGSGELVSVTKLAINIEKPIARLDNNHIDIMLPREYDDSQIRKMNDFTLDLRTLRGSRTQRYVTMYII